jgi:LysM repeat protein
MNSRLAIFFLICLPLLSGCRTTEIEQEQSSQRATLQDLQDKVGHLQNTIGTVQAENDDLKGQVAQLKDELNSSQSTNAEYRKDLERLDSLIKKLDSAREQDRKIVVEEVSREISSLAKKIQNASPTKDASPTPTKQKVQEGYEHVVAKGDTLSAIAKAYKVSVQSIRDANKLTKTELKIGQKLFIPKS